MRPIGFVLALAGTTLLAGCVTQEPFAVVDGQALHVAVPPTIAGQPITHSQVELLYAVIQRQPGVIPLFTAEQKASETCNGTAHGSQFVLRSVTVRGALLEIYFYCLTSSVPVGTTLPAPPTVTVVRPAAAG